MMRTAILLAVALALTVAAVPAASADPIYKCVSDEKFTGNHLCVLVTEDCITAGGQVGGLRIEGHCG